MFVDASAMIAILAREPEREHFLDVLESCPDRSTSVIAVWEAIAGLARKRAVPVSVAHAAVLEFLATAEARIEPLTLNHLAPALEAFERYGRHVYAESDRNRALNLGDCFHYACARLAGTAILHKDVGLGATDLPPAGTPA